MSLALASSVVVVGKYGGYGLYPRYGGYGYQPYYRPLVAPVIAPGFGYGYGIGPSYGVGLQAGKIGGVPYYGVNAGLGYGGIGGGYPLVLG